MQPGQPQSITPLDRDYLELKTAIRKLSQQVTELQQSIAEFAVQSSAAIGNLIPFR